MTSDPQTRVRSAGEAQDPRVFFEAMLPAIIKTRGDIFDRSTARVCIMVQGVGAWTLRFGDHLSREALLPQVDMEADLVVTFARPSMERLLAGEAIDPQKIQMAYFGDTDVLQLLGRLLVAPARGGIAAQLANMS